MHNRSIFKGNSSQSFDSPNNFYKLKLNECFLVVKYTSTKCDYVWTLSSVPYKISHTTFLFLHFTVKFHIHIDKN
jgi:hypothetical protein